MGTAIVATDANRENAGNARIIPPVTRGLQSWLILNDDLTKLQHNFLDGITGASVIAGAPAVSATSTRFTGQTNYLTLPFMSSADDCTILAVAKIPGAFSETASIVSDYASSGSPSLALAFQAAGYIRLTVSQKNSDGSSFTSHNADLTSQNISS